MPFRLHHDYAMNFLSPHSHPPVILFLNINDRLVVKTKNQIVNLRKTTVCSSAEFKLNMDIIQNKF